MIEYELKNKDGSQVVLRAPNFAELEMLIMLHEKINGSNKDVVKTEQVIVAEEVVTIQEPVIVPAEVIPTETVAVEAETVSLEKHNPYTNPKRKNRAGIVRFKWSEHDAQIVIMMLMANYNNRKDLPKKICKVLTKEGDHKKRNRAAVGSLMNRVIQYAEKGDVIFAGEDLSNLLMKMSIKPFSKEKSTPVLISPVKDSVPDIPVLFDSSVRIRRDLIIEDRTQEPEEA